MRPRCCAGAPGAGAGVVLLEVEHAACKNSRVRWAFQLDLERHYNMDTTGIPAEHTQSVFQLECE
jgi:hypothetical protein